MFTFEQTWYKEIQQPIYNYSNYEYLKIFSKGERNKFLCARTNFS